MREARLENRSIPLRLGAAPGVKSAPRRWSAPRPRRRGGVQFHVQRAQIARVERLDKLLPFVENVMQSAGYLVLTIGAAVLLFHFAP